jgi:predicted alpha/beta hydrolase family esterase
MKNVVILHGISGTPNDFWFPWVAKQLEKKGYTVSVPQLPDADNPQADTWLPAALKETITPETVLISHSASGTLILRILEQIDVQIKQAILVAGFAKPKKGYTLPEGILKKRMIGNELENMSKILSLLTQIMILGELMMNRGDIC